ncbi:MAG: hypothetical protein HYT20_02615 [Candidatus Nealsonbacteria bacterium]|nr:hypothetical protein [Candidatus Nealsonbacteria bacterium]
MPEKSTTTLAFIDASNLFYGGEKSLGWKIDYQKLLDYLKNKYKISQAFYFGGVERKTGKEVLILARGPRTAREIRQFAGSNFRDFVRIEKYIKF